ncbi:MAG: lipopolysaccharide transport periplasmic protein LptA [Thermodesulfobacteriota bacterium]|nr:MAG: lipopolysaccharide transport periplasmic protein LptA [Thermodesulfobacteriota bacterium]
MISYKNTDKYLQGFFSGKTVFCVFLVLLLLLWVGDKNTIWGKSAAQVGILPFQIFSGEKVEYLNEVIATNLSQQLKTKEEFAIINQEEINNISRKKAGSGTFSPQELSLIAERTGAHFLIYGSLTKIEDNLSIDARVFTTLMSSPPYKDFVEGKDLDLLLKNLGDKISHHVSQVVLAFPPPAVIAEAPQVAEITSSSQEEQATTTTQTNLNKQASEPATVATAEASSEQTTAAPEAPSEPTPSAPATEAQTTQKPAPSSSVKEESSLGKTKSPPQVPETGKTQTHVMEQPSEPMTDSTAEAPSGHPKKASDDKAQLLKPKGLSSDQPVNITSDRMVADNRNRTVSFLGNVVAKREDMIIFSDQLSTVYTEQNTVEKIIARGNVKINQTDRTATCQEATFFQLPQQKVVMTGKPKVWQGKNIITGDKIIVFIKEDRVEVESGKQEDGKKGRVNAIIYPGGKGVNK